MNNVSTIPITFKIRVETRYKAEDSYPYSVLIFDAPWSSVIVPLHDRCADTFGRPDPLTGEAKQWDYADGGHYAKFSFKKETDFTFFLLLSGGSRNVKMD